MQIKLSNFCSKIIEAGWILSLVLIPLLFNPYSQQAGRIFEGNKVFLLRSITLIMLLAWLIKLIENKKPFNSQVVFKHSLVLLTALLFLFYLISTFLSPYFPISLRGFYLRDEGFYTFFSYLIIFFLCIQNIKKEQQIDLLVTSLILVSIPISAYAIFQHFGKDPVKWVGMFQERVTSTFGGPIFLGAYLIMIIPLTILRIIQNRIRIFSLISYSILLLLHLFALYFTQSRGPQIGLLVALFFLALIISARLRIKWLLISVIAIVVLIAGFLVLPQIPNSPLSGLKPYLGRFGLDSGSGTTIKVRLAIWKSAESIVADKPARLITGYGLESMPFLYYKHYNPEIAKYEGEEVVPDHSHNDTFDLLITIGIPGLVLFLGIIILTGYSALKYLGLISNKQQMILFYSCLAIAFVVFIIFSLIIGGIICAIGLGIPIGLVFGLGLYLIIHILRPSRTATTPSPISKSEMLIMALLAGIIAHFMEIQFGIGLTTTRLYFWGFIALIVSIINLTANQQQFTDGQKDKSNTALTYSILAGLILTVIAFSLLRYNLNSEQINYFVLLYASIIVVGGLILIPEAISSLSLPHLIMTSILYLIISIGWSGLFIGVYSSLLSAETSMVSYIILLYIWLGINLLVLMFILPSIKIFPEKFINKGIYAPLRAPVARAVIYFVLGVIVAVIIYQTNLKEIYAETFYKQATRTKAKQWDNLIGDYRKAIKLSPHTDYYYESLSDAYLTKGDYAKSIEVMESAVQANSYNPRHIRKLATLYRIWGMLSPVGSERNKRFDKALESYKMLTTDYAPTNPLYFKEYGDALKYKGDCNGALEKYLEALIKTPNSGLIYLALGDLYRDNIVNTNQAITYYEKAFKLGITLNSNQAVVLCNYYYNEKRYEDFIRINTILIHNDPGNYQHRFYMAQAYKTLGKKPEALQETKQALNLAPPEKKQLLEELIRELER